MSVSFISLSLSSFRSCMTVSASLSVHSEILEKIKTQTSSEATWYFSDGASPVLSSKEGTNSLTVQAADNSFGVLG